MRRTQSRLAAAAALTLLVCSIVPAALASSVTVDLNPKTGTAKFTAQSTTKIVLTYPANSTLSSILRGNDTSLTLKGNFSGSAEALQELQDGMDERTSSVSVKNMSVVLTTSASSNGTALVISKQTTITGWVSGVFSVSNGTVMANMAWRSFRMPGQADMELQGHLVDVNLVGSALLQPLSGRTLAIAFLTSAFGGGSVWNRPTIDFAALNSSLGTWTRNYDSATNTTTFSKTVSENSDFSASVDRNGQKYTLSAVSDPSGTISVQGYALASGNSLQIAKESSGSEPAVVIGAFVIAAVAVLAVAIFAAKRSKGRETPTRHAEPTPQVVKN
jgi:hypothetical protein